LSPQNPSTNHTGTSNRLAATTRSQARMTAFLVALEPIFKM